MMPSDEPLVEQVRHLLGRARLIYWDDADASAEVKALTDLLSGPLPLEIVGGSPEDEVALRSVVGQVDPEVRVGTPAAAVLVIVGSDSAPRVESRREATLPVALVSPGSGGPDVGRIDARPIVPVVLRLASATIGASDAQLPEALADRSWLGVDAASAPFGPTLAAAELRQEAERRSGLDALRRSLGELRGDADTLRASAAMAGLDAVLAARPRRGTEEVAIGLETLRLGAHEPRELAASVLLRAGVPGLSDADRADALAMLASGSAREGGQLLERLGYWRTLASDPSLSPSVREAAATVARACERRLA